MAKQDKNRLSLLVLPDENSAELYLWYAGNPFGLRDKKSAIAVLENQAIPTEPVDYRSVEIAKSMYRVSEGMGYLIAKRDFVVAQAPLKGWMKAAHGLLDFFPSEKSEFRRVKDNGFAIAQDPNIERRMNRVRGVAGDFATLRLPEVAFDVPRPQEQPEPDISVPEAA